MAHVIALSGSLRSGSYNTALVRAAADLAPPDPEYNDGVSPRVFDAEGRLTDDATRQVVRDLRRPS